MRVSQTSPVGAPSGATREALQVALEEIATIIEAQVPITRAYLVDNGFNPNFADVLLSHYLDLARSARERAAGR
ncbi:hypothetical protein [Devosia sp.]|uniref:hypothetical protein n=1 Tax=Devosia sp. TaxID=1871048 RepID=UPI002FC7B756